LLFTLFSLVKFKLRDRPISLDIWQTFFDMCIGMCYGAFYAMPLYWLFANPPQDYHHGQGLGVYLKCEGVTFWQKVSAVSP